MDQMGANPGRLPHMSLGRSRGRTRGKKGECCTGWEGEKGESEWHPFCIGGRKRARRKKKKKREKGTTKLRDRTSPTEKRKNAESHSAHESNRAGREKGGGGLCKNGSSE